MHDLIAIIIQLGNKGALYVENNHDLSRNNVITHFMHKVRGLIYFSDYFVY